MKTSSSLQLLAAALPLISAHGIIETPAPRLAGKAMKAACGEQVYNNQASDSGGNVQGVLQVAASQKDYDPTKCNVHLCKGYQFEDNTANIQTYTAGQTISLQVSIKAPHTGVANVSIVNTKSNSVIGGPLISFSDYASNSHTIPKNNTQFSITMPQDLGGKCGVAGECVIQWFWDAPDIKQTYLSCIDFKTGGDGGGAAPVGAAVSSSIASPVASVSASLVSNVEDAEDLASEMGSIEKRQVMESMSTGPKTTLGISVMPMSSEATSSSSVAVSAGTGSASQSSKTASNALVSGTASASAGSIMSSNVLARYKAPIRSLIASVIVLVTSQ